MSTFRPLEVKFYLDGSGINMCLNDPIMIDALMSYVLIRYTNVGYLDRTTVPHDLEHLPLGKWKIEDVWGYHASCLLPSQGNYFETLRFFRKKYRLDYFSVTKGSPVLTNGKFREHNVPAFMVCCNELVGYAFGDRRKVYRLLKRISYLGKKRSFGYGRILSVDVKEIDNNWSCVKDGKAMRYLFNPDGDRVGRVRSPYWNKTNMVKSCFIGDDVFELSQKYNLLN